LNKSSARFAPTNTPANSRRRRGSDAVPVLGLAQYQTLPTPGIFVAMACGRPDLDLYVLGISGSIRLSGYGNLSDFPKWRTHVGTEALTKGRWRRRRAVVIVT
jgi:hypothetical protein